MTPGTPRLVASGLDLRHPGAERDAVRDLHLEVRHGEVLVLVGPNGSGKSTTLAGLARDLRPRAGELLLDGRPVWSLSRRAFATTVARLPQEPACPEGLSVEQLVANGRHAHRRLLRGPERADHAALEAAVAALDLGELRQRAVTTLSGGERRRAWLAMVLCQEAEIVLLDEPTAALDLRHQWELLTLLTELNQRRGVTLVVVLHDLEQACRIADRLALFHRGRLYEVGAPRQVVRADTLRDVFRVEAHVGAADSSPTLHVLGPAEALRSL